MNYRNYNKSIKITFDLTKDSSNRLKHGVSLSMANHFDWQDALCWKDERHDYGEPRMTALGYVGVRLYCIAFVDRENARRIISLRKANSREVKRYAET